MERDLLMGIRRMAPQGYSDITAAIYHLVRHGPTVFGRSRFLVLLYHCERATSYGKESDQHSQDQAMRGVYSPKAQRRTGGYGCWIRGGCGVSIAQYKRENLALLKDGLISKIRHSGLRRSAATEFVPNWLAIRAALEAQEFAEPTYSQPLLEDRNSTSHLAHPEPDETSSSGSPRATHLAHGEPPIWLTVSHTVGELTIKEFTVGRSRAREEADSPPIGETTYPPSWEEEKQTTSLREIAEALESAMGRRLFADSPAPAKLWQIAARLRMPAAALCRWISEAAARVMARPGFKITGPNLFIAMAGEELILWCREHITIIDQIWRVEYQEYTARRWRKSSLAEMPGEPVFSACENCGQEAVVDGICESKECFVRRQCEWATWRAANG